MADRPKHTPLQWKLAGECEPLQTNIGSQLQIWENMEHGRVIAVVVSTEDPSIGVAEGIANAELIVNCVNRHDALVAALRMSLDGLLAAFPFADKIRDILQPIIADVRMALGDAVPAYESTPKTERQFFVKDRSGRGATTTLTLAEFPAAGWDMDYTNDEEDCGENLLEWLQEADVGDEYHHSEKNADITRIE